MLKIMKYNTFTLATLIVCLAIFSAYGNNFSDELKTFSKDTVPESGAKVSNDTTQTDSTFSDIESELQNLEPKSKDSDTTKIRIGKMKISVVDDGDDIVVNKEDDWDDKDWDEDWTWKDNDDNWTFHRKPKKSQFSPHWAGFSMGLNNYVTSDLSTLLPAEYSLLAVNTNNSFEVNLNFAQVGLNLIKNHVGFVTGVGIKWNNYKFRNENTVLSSDSTVLIYSESSDTQAKMSKLTTCYLMVPLLIEFQIPSHGEDFYLSAGVEGGLKLGAHTKIKTNDKVKNKDKSDFFTTFLDYRLTARLGYGNFGIYGSYSMMPLFEKDLGPELYPLAVGVALNF